MQGEHGERDRQSPPLTAGTILLTTEESLRALNASMAAGGFDDVAMSRMRPNLVVPPAACPCPLAPRQAPRTAARQYRPRGL